jgi:hypothetical protein
MTLAHGSSILCPTAELHRVAIHEAGHIIVADTLGEPFGVAEVGRDDAGEAYGHVRWRHDYQLGFLRPLRLATALRLIDVFAAGAAADAIFLNQPGSRPLRIPGRWDGDLFGIHEAVWACRHLPHGERAVQRLIRDRAPALQAMIRARWCAVEEIAEHLIARGRLGPTRAKAIVARSLATNP